MYDHERDDRDTPPRRGGTSNTSVFSLTGEDRYARKVIRPYSSSYPAQASELDGLVTRYLASRELSGGIAQINGWYPTEQAGDHYPRVVIPATSRVAENCFWQARLLSEPQDWPEEPPRYQSPCAARGDAVVAVWPPGQGAGGWRGAVIVEGAFDALAAAGEGYVGVALLGNTPPNESLDLTRLLLRGIIRPIMVVADADALEAMADVFLRLAAGGGFPCLEFRIPPSGYKDLAGIPKSGRSAALA